MLGQAIWEQPDKWLQLLLALGLFGSFCLFMYKGVVWYVKLDRVLNNKYKMSPEESQRQLKDTIELVRKWELGDYTVVHQQACHYRFELTSGKIIPRIGIVEVVGCKDWLVENGHYRKAVVAEVFVLADFRR
jgi:hypothetical protein